MAAVRQKGEPMKKLNLALPDKIHQALKIQSAKEGRPMGNVLLHLVVEYLSNRGELPEDWNE